MPTPTESPSPAADAEAAADPRDARGPVPDGAAPLPPPPVVPLGRRAQSLRINVRQTSFLLRARRELGPVFGIRTMIHPGTVAVTTDPEDVRAIMRAPKLAVSTTGESPLRPIVGPDSVLTAVGPRHLRQRRLLLPPFHGDAVARYVEQIRAAVHREVDTWPVGEPFALGPRMQAVTLDVIMGGVFGVGARPEPGSPAAGVRRETTRLIRLSTTPAAQVLEFANLGRAEPLGVLRAILGRLDRHLYRLIAERRAQAGEPGTDILSLLLSATAEDGRALDDHELRDELLTLVLAGHETTANQLAWTFERLVRTPAAHGALRDAVRGDDAAAAAALVEATVQEGMRVRPVIPIIGRRVTVPWRLAGHDVPADGIVLVHILGLHLRDDVYDRARDFRPERFLAAAGGEAPGTYTWLPFGGGIRRCLGAALAMAEQREVLSAVVRRCDLVAADPAPERPKHRNVTMVPSRGGTVVLRRRVD